MYIFFPHIIGVKFRLRRFIFVKAVSFSYGGFKSYFFGVTVIIISTKMGNGALVNNAQRSENPLSFERHLELRQLVLPFYESIPSTKDLQGSIRVITSDSWKSFSGATTFVDRDTFIQQAEKFKTITPDLNW